MNCSDVELRRCTAAQVARVLEAMTLEPHRIWLTGPWDRDTVMVRWRRAHLLLGTVMGERVVLWAALPGVHGVEQWELGCERDDWTLGPDSRLVEPLGLLTERSRGQLWEVLAAADVEESGIVMPGPVVA